MEKWIKKLLSIRNTDLDLESYKRAKLVLLDTLGSIIAGNQEKESKQLMESYHLELKSCEEGVPIYGTEYCLPYYDAGFLNGQASVAIEMDEGNQYSKGHPAAHVVPVLLTVLSRRKNIEGIDMLNALIIGYEICSRFGRAVSLRSDAHAHGTWGILGSAATAMLLEDNVTLEDMKKSLLLSASFVLPTQWKSALGGHTVRNLYAGHAIEYGLRIPSLVKAGYEAPPDSIEHIFGNVIGNAIDMNIFSTTNSKWDIELNYFKPYAYCRYVHAPIEAFKKSWEKYKKKDRGILQPYPQKIKVRTYKRASSLSEKYPSNVLSAKFSIPYAIAVAALYDITNHQAFDTSILTNPNVREFSNRVEVEYSKELEGEYPSKMPAVVDIYDFESEIYSARVDIAKGGPGYELSEEDIITKFLLLTKNEYEEKIQRQIVFTILNIEEYLFGDLMLLLKKVKKKID